MSLRDTGVENHYFQLSMWEREWIAIMRGQGKTVSEIARDLRRHKSTIAREVRRNASRVYGCYLGHRAQARAVLRHAVARQRSRLKPEAPQENDRIRSYVIEKLQVHWSPVSTRYRGKIIAGRIGSEHPGLTISPEAIYHPASPRRLELIACLWRAHRSLRDTDVKRKKKGVGRKERRTKIPNRIPTDDRPAVVAARTRFGDWSLRDTDVEGDSLVSRKSSAALNTLTSLRDTEWNARAGSCS